MARFNVIITILITILEFTIAIFDILRGKIFWAIIFAIIGILYIIYMVPLSWRNYKRDVRLKKEWKEIQERIDKEWGKFQDEDISKL